VTQCNMVIAKSKGNNTRTVDSLMDVIILRDENYLCGRTKRERETQENDREYWSVSDAVVVAR
jgi:hypothetical protein